MSESPKKVAADVAVVIQAEGLEPHTLATATIVFSEGKSGYYTALADVLHETADKLREDAAK